MKHLYKTQSGDNLSLKPKKKVEWKGHDIITKC